MRFDFKLKKELKEFLRKKLKEEIERVYVYSPYKLSDEELTELKKKIKVLQRGRVINKIDDSLIAGIKIKTGSKVMDFSVRHKLNSLKQVLYENIR